MKGRHELKYLPYQSRFDHKYACWAINHNGWSKMKKLNRRTTKHRLKQIIRTQINECLEGMK